MLKGIYPILRLIEAEWRAFQLRTINPLAPDLPRLVVRKNHLEVPL